MTGTSVPSLQQLQLLCRRYLSKRLYTVPVSKLVVLHENSISQAIAVSENAHGSVKACRRWMSLRDICLRSSIPWAKGRNHANLNSPLAAVRR